MHGLWLALVIHVLRAKLCAMALVPVTVRIPEELLAEFDRILAHTPTTYSTRSDFIRRAVEDFVREASRVR